MTAETAIVQLKNRAETARLHASNSRQINEADELEQICNAIIDHYNQAELMELQRNNLLALVQLLAEYIGIAANDTDDLKRADAAFLRRRLMCRSEEIAEASDYYIWHKVLTDYWVYISSLQSIAEEKENLRILKNLILMDRQKLQNQDILLSPPETPFLDAERQILHSIDQTNTLISEME